METTNYRYNLRVSCSGVGYNYVGVLGFVLQLVKHVPISIRLRTGGKGLGLCMGQKACWVGPGLNFSIF